MKIPWAIQILSGHRVVVAPPPTSGGGKEAA
jgi:hypothetical protein